MNHHLPDYTKKHRPLIIIIWVVLTQNMQRQRHATHYYAFTSVCLDKLHHSSLQQFVTIYPTGLSRGREKKNISRVLDPSNASQWFVNQAFEIRCSCELNLHWLVKNPPTILLVCLAMWTSFPPKFRKILNCSQTIHHFEDLVIQSVLL